MKDKIENILKIMAVGGAFMVPVAGFPLAIYVAKKLYGDDVSLGKVIEVFKELGKMRGVKQEGLSFRDYILMEGL